MGSMSAGHVVDDAASRHGSVDPPPDSAMPSSENAPSAGELTYRVYTYADLEAWEKLRSPRTSMAPAPPPPSRWPEVWKAAVNVTRALEAWSKSPKPRPSVIDACRLPLRVLLSELELALRALPWKKLGLWAAAVLGMLSVLFFLVLTVAELTDDLKPARPGARTMVRNDAPATPSFSTNVATKSPDAPKTIEAALVIDLDVPGSFEMARTRDAPGRAGAFEPNVKTTALKSEPVEIFIP